MPRHTRLCCFKKSPTRHIFCVEYAPIRERRAKRAFLKTLWPEAGLWIRVVCEIPHFHLLGDSLC